jgi:CheY-like chemotaxis protein
MSKATVLVIDDNRDILDVVRLQLEAEGFSVILAQDCASAFDCLSLYGPDIVVTDLFIPEINGLEFILYLRRVSNYDRIPVIAMSAYDRTYLDAAVKAGAVDAFHKPEEMDRLPQAIVKALASVHTLS